jgi:hypothetical protein
MNSPIVPCLAFHVHDCFAMDMVARVRNFVAHSFHMSGYTLVGRVEGDQNISRNANKLEWQRQST